jgi:hypothetical protein
MGKFIVEAFVYPLMAILFCLGFGGPFVFAGFQTLHIECTRTPSSSISCDLTRRHFFGLYSFHTHIDGLKSADIMTSRSGGARSSLTSGAYLLAEGGKVPLFFGSSNTDDRLKWDVIKKINAFIGNRGEAHFSENFRMYNIFGFFGLPFLIFGLLGIIGWPSAIIGHVKKARSS